MACLQRPRYESVVGDSATKLLFSALSPCLLPRIAERLKEYAQRTGKAERSTVKQLRKISPATVNKELRYVRAVLRIAKEWKIITDVAFGEIRGNRQGGTVQLIYEIVIATWERFSQDAGPIREVNSPLVDLKILEHERHE
jgi:hypothetical protein